VDGRSTAPLKIVAGLLLSVCRWLFVFARVHGGVPLLYCTVRTAIEGRPIPIRTLQVCTVKYDSDSDGGTVLLALLYSIIIRITIDTVAFSAASSAAVEDHPRDNAGRNAWTPSCCVAFDTCTYLSRDPAGGC